MAHTRRIIEFAVQPDGHSRPPFPYGVGVHSASVPQSLRSTAATQTGHRNQSRNRGSGGQSGWADPLGAKSLAQNGEFRRIWCVISERRQHSGAQKQWHGVEVANERFEPSALQSSKDDQPAQEKSDQQTFTQFELFLKFGCDGIRRVFGPACLYGRVIKTRRNDCVVKVERRAVLDDRWRLEQALQDSEDTVKLTLVRRTIESHDPTGLSVSWQADDLSNSADTMSQRITLSYFAAITNPASYCLTSLCL